MSDDHDAPTYGTTRRILGVPTRVRSDSAGIIELADRAFAAWPRTRARPRVRLRLDATLETSGAGAADVRYRLPSRERLIISGAGLRVRVDAGRGRARGRFAKEWLYDPQHLRYAVLEAATLFMLTARDRVPFHAAAIARGDDAILIAGPSGAGKSTLALAALRAGTGWRLLSEDCVYIEARTRTRVWGWPGFLHVTPDTSRFFPDLAGRNAAVLATGKRKIALSTPVPDRPWARRVALCILRRTGLEPRLEPADPARSIGNLTGDLEPGFDRFEGALPAVFESLLGTRVWTLDAGPDPRLAIPLLDGIFGVDSPSR